MDAKSISSFSSADQNGRELDRQTRVEYCFPPTGPMGIEFEDGPMRIKDLIPEGEAAANSRLQPGDVLISVNGQNVENLVFEDVVAILHAATGSENGRLVVFARRAPAKLQGPSVSFDFKDEDTMMETSQESEGLGPLMSQMSQASEISFETPVRHSKRRLSKSSQASSSKNTSKTGRSAKSTDRSRKSGKKKVQRASSILSTIRQRLVTTRTAREEAMRQEDTSRRADVIAPLQRTVTECLETNPVIRPHRVKVINDSYWYRNREIMSAKYHMGFSIDRNEPKKQWDAKIYKIDMDLDHKLVAKTDFVGSHKTEVAAFKACEKAMKERDQNPGVAEGVKTVTQNNLLATHFRVNVVSTRFRGKSLIERLSMVFEALAEEFWAPQTCPRGRSCIHDPVLRMKKYSIVGNEVLRLPFFQNIGRLHAVLIISCFTPSQWKPKTFEPTEEELYTKTRTGAGALAENAKISKNTNAKMLKSLLKDGSNVDIEKERAKGVYGHFFHSLNPEMKKLMLEEYSKSKVIKVNDPSLDDPTALIEKTEVQSPTKEGETNTSEERNEKTSTEKKKKKKSKRKNDKAETKMEGTLKAKSVLGKSLIEESSLVDKDKELVGAYQMHNRRMGMMAQRIQRIWRVALFSKAIRWTLRRHYAAIRIQCLVRGVYGRMYVKLFRRVAAVASLRLQARWRGVLGRKRVAEWRAILIPAVIKVQRAYRHRLLMLFMAYLRTYYAAARQIQRIIRGFNARQRFKKKRARTYPNNKTRPAVRLIQRVWRGYRGRLIYKQKLTEMIFRVVAIPAIHLMQRIFRGGRGRKIARQRRLEFRMAAQIQKLVRGFLKRCWWKKLNYWWFQNHMASQMEKVGRGYIDRQMVTLRIEKDWFYEVLQPCATRIQAVYRGFVERSRLEERKQRWLAALQLQMAYRTSKAMQLMREKWRQQQLRIKNKAATDIQKIWRACKSKMIFKAVHADQTWKRLYAGRMIMRCWLRYRMNKRLKELSEEWECTKSGTILNRLFEERVNIKRDMKDAEDDLSETRKMYQMAKDRIKELRNFLAEAELRLPKVEEELDNLEIDDIEHGWGESFDDEWNRLTNQMALATEEIHLQKVYMNDCKTQINELQLEVEELLMDLDDNNVRAVEELEYLRRVQLNRGGRRQKTYWADRVRYETVHWKIQDIRSKVIRRTRKDLDQYENEALLHRNQMLEIASTISYDKYHARLDSEKIQVKKKDEAARKKKYDETADKVYQNLPVRETYDAVVSSTFDLLKGFTFDQRRRKMVVGDFTA